VAENLERDDRDETLRGGAQATFRFFERTILNLCYADTTNEDRRFVHGAGLGPDQYVAVTCRLTDGGARTPFALLDVRLASNGEPSHSTHRQRARGDVVVAAAHSALKSRRTRQVPSRRVATVRGCRSVRGWQ